MPGGHPSAPLVSVVIPNYNYARYLGAAIDSVLAQTYQRIEVIVVDDGSTDDSEQVISRYQGRIRSFRQANQGVSAARNLGIRASEGAAIAFLDADDLWDPTKIERQVARLDEPSVGLVHCGIEYIDGSGKTVGIDLTGAEGRILRRHALLRTTTVHTGSSALVRRDCFDGVGLFDTALSTSADWDMWRRIGCRYEVAMVPLPLLKYRLHGSAMHRNVDLFERDMLHAFARMFEDPAATEIFPSRRTCYANLYATLCGSYLHEGRWRKGLQYGLKSLLQRPDRLTLQVLGLPLRRAARHLAAARQRGRAT